MSTASPLLELILTGTWSSLTCWMRGNRRERASLALMATAAHSLPSGTRISYQIGTYLSYQGTCANPPSSETGGRSPRVIFTPHSTESLTYPTPDCRATH